MTGLLDLSTADRYTVKVCAQCEVKEDIQSTTSCNTSDKPSVAGVCHPMPTVALTLPWRQLVCSMMSWLESQSPSWSSLKVSATLRPVGCRLCMACTTRLCPSSSTPPLGAPARSASAPWCVCAGFRVGSRVRVQGPPACHVSFHNHIKASLGSYQAICMR